MRESGFDPSQDDERDRDLHAVDAFAPAHRITGVRLTPELFESVEFVCGGAES